MSWLASLRSQTSPLNSDQPQGSGERLQRYEHVLGFARAAGVLAAAEVDELAAEAERHPRRAAATCRAAIAPADSPV